MLPALMTFYPGLKPWDLEHLTFGEIQTLIEAMEEAAKRHG